MCIQSLVFQASFFLSFFFVFCVAIAMCVACIQVNHWGSRKTVKQLIPIVVTDKFIVCPAHDEYGI